MVGTSESWFFLLAFFNQCISRGFKKEKYELLIITSYLILFPVPVAIFC